MRKFNAKKVRSLKADLKKLEDERDRLKATHHRDDMQHFIVAGIIKRLKAEIAVLERAPNHRFNWS